MLALARDAQASEFQLLHKIVTETPQRMHLKSRRPFATHAHELLHTTPADICKAACVKAKWRDQWKSAEPSRLHLYVEDSTDVPGRLLPRKQWTILNRLRTGVGCFGAAMMKWGIVDSARCECGDPLQTVEHILTSCPIYRPPHGERGLIELDHRTLVWLASTELKV
ncbi:hypothetical protein UPYG_G00340690 [Umbra pygmaea]|uniref:Reverse transcriptase n=1 Tax=Umbra pygmaea TaxID=75934 RepID=A0ABD0VXQ8_UMBPY